MSRPESGSHPHAKRSGTRAWRAATLATFAAAAGLFVTSAIQSNGVDLRAASVTDLHTLVQQRRDVADEQQAQIARLTAQIEQLGERAGDQQTRRLQRKVHQMRGPAGFTPVRGSGLRISVSDTEKDRAAQLLADETTIGGRPITGDDLVVHQQDLQAIVNALWLGGAEGVTLMGQRLITTTGIKCVGNTVVIKDIPYAPPYKIEAVGDPQALRAALYSEPRVVAYLDAVAALDLGWTLDTETDLRLPAYSGSPDLSYARAVREQ